MKIPFKSARSMCSGGLGVLAFIATAVSSGGSALAADKVSAEVGTSYNTHFISYGSDVWKGNRQFYGDRSTQFYWGNVNVKATDALTFNVGAWADVNNNTTSSIGGDLQEVDVWVGGKYAVGPATLGVAYQKWHYSGDIEEIVDLSLGLDDSKIFGGFSLSPAATWHFRTEGNGTQKTGSVLVLSVGPSFKLTDSLSLTVPAGFGYFMTDDYHSGTDGGIGYSFVGASLAVPVSFIPPAYGAWTAKFDLLAYFTDKDVIPNNPEENFLTGSIGLTLAF